jgi:hypothetical protein
VICDSPAGIERGATLAMRFGTRFRSRHGTSRSQDREGREGAARPS